MDAFTISATQDRHTEEHSRRSYTPFSADSSLAGNNIVIYDCGDDRVHFNSFFLPHVEAYNARQKRKDRKKDLDYLSALEDGREGYGKGEAHEKTFYHDVLQIGNRNTNGITKRTFEVDHWRKLKRDGKYSEASAYVKKHLNDTKVNEDFIQIYIEIGNEILENKDHLYDGILVHGLTIHCDEPSGTPHLDFRYTFYCEGERTGLDTRVSQRKALAKLGFRTDREQTALQKFRESIKDRIEEKMIERGYERDKKNEHRTHQSTIVYEMEQRAQEAEEKLKDAEEERLKKLQEIDEAQETAIDDFTKKIREKAKKLNEEYSVLKEELKDRKTAVEKREDKLDERENALDEREQECDAWEEDLQIREKRIQKREEDLETEKEEVREDGQYCREMYERYRSGAKAVEDLLRKLKGMETEEDKEEDKDLDKTYVVRIIDRRLEKEKGYLKTKKLSQVISEVREENRKRRENQIEEIADRFTDIEREISGDEYQ